MFNVNVGLCASINFNISNNLCLGVLSVLVVLAVGAHGLPKVDVELEALKAEIKAELKAEIKVFFTLLIIIM